MNRPAFLLAAGFLLASMLTTSAPAAATGDGPAADVPPKVAEALNTTAAAASSVASDVAAVGANVLDTVCGVAPVSVLHCCGEFIVSEPGGSTRWSDDDGPGAIGLNDNPIQVSATSLIAGAARLWKESPPVGEGSATDDGVIFVTSWLACPDDDLPQAFIRVLSDNANRVYLNNQPIGTCGVWGQHADCFNSPQGYLEQISPYPNANTLRIHVMNGDGDGFGNPATVAFRVDF
jgi:hypothetical protein